MNNEAVNIECPLDQLDRFVHPLLENGYDVHIFFDGENTEVTYLNGNRANFHSFIGENKIIGNNLYFDKFSNKKKFHSA